MFDQLYESEAAAPAEVAVTVATPAAPAAVVTSIKAAVLAQFKATEPVLQALVTRYENVAIDCSTPKGLAAAKEARHDLRENGRFVVQRAEKAIKDEVNGLKTVIASEAERLIAIVQPTESLYDDAIKAREAELAAEKAERERKEAERVAAHRANITRLAGYAIQAQGRTSEQILTVINGVAGIDIIPEQWEEFAVGAEIQKAETLEALQVLFDATKRAEDEAAAHEAQRIENERKAAELAAREAEMAAKQAELDAKLAAIAAAEQAKADEESAHAARVAQRYVNLAQQQAEDEANAHAAEASAALIAEKAEEAADDLSQDAMPDQLSDDALAAMPSIADAVLPVDRPAAVPLDMDEVANQAWHFSGRMTVSTGVLLPTESPIQFAERPAASNEPTLTLGALNARFGVFSINAEGLAALGFQPIATKKAAKLYSEAQFLAIADAIVERIGEIVCACES